MTFTVTYRGADGALRTEAVEAASRGDCLAQMKARGVSVQGVEACAGKRASHGGDRREPIAGAGQNRNAAAWVLSVVCVLLAVGIGWYCLSVRHSSEAAIHDDGPKKPGAFAKEVKPAVAPKEMVETGTNSTPPTKDEKRARQLKQIREKYGDNIPENLKPVVYFLENPPQQTFHPAKTKASIFKRRCEREIAEMIMTAPGTWFMRKPTFGERFDSDFKASLTEEIEFSDTDTPEQRELKKAVIDTKNELAARMEAGEKPSDAMNAFAGSMYDLGQYRRTLQDELGKIKRDASYSDKDIQDFVDVANKMLKEKGAQPIPMPKMVFRHISLKKAAAKAAEKKTEKAK